MLGVPFQRPGQHHVLHVAPDGGQRRHVHRVVHAGHVLLDDRALVEVGGHVVGGRADQLHAAVVGLLVGARALEAGQEGMVDVDRAAFQLAAQLGRQDLHVAGEHHQLDAFAVGDLQQARLGMGLARGGDRHVVEGNVVGRRQLVEIPMVRHDRADVDRQQPGAPAEQQVVQAVPQLRDQDQRGHGAGRVGKAEAHAEALGHRREGRREVRLRRGEVHAHEEQPGVAVVELAGFQDVAALFEEEAGNGVDDARTVRTGKGEDVAVFHRAGGVGGSRAQVYPVGSTGVPHAR